MITLHDSQVNLKVGDFGVAKVVTDSEYAGELRSYYMGTAQGTQLFMAPDVFDGCYTEKADVFSMGLVYAAMWSGQSLQWKQKRFLGVIMVINGEYLPIGKAMQENKLDKYTVANGSNKVPKNIKKLIERMTAKYHHERPSAAQVARVLESKQCIIL
ncbi:serine/threonine-protein kinase pdik1l-B-like [Amphiura filiformis]|uniref:serine/threonine-protein kinase pdik1l-B-like n=1 Tax=Amphiura filiformis TaxID=82378 RepID=UPI003B21F256